MTTKETEIDKGMKVADTLRKYPWTIPVFNRYGIDTCCKGQLSIEASAAEKHVDLEELIESLKNAR
jgi:regulator of cell morphogenesis and NO signaling